MLRKPQRAGETDEVLNHGVNDNKKLSLKPNKSSTSYCRLFTISSVLLFISSIFYLLLTRLGIGSPFPVQSAFLDSYPLLPESALKIVAELPAPPGNIAVSSTGRVFFNFHPEYEPNIKIAELHDVTNFKAYPSMDFQKEIITCLSLRIDQQDRLWLLDYAFHGIKGTPKLLAIDIAENSPFRDTVVHNYTFPSDVAGFGSMLNDFQVDSRGDFIYIADTSIIGATPALIVYSLQKGVSYRILSGHSSMFGFSTLLNINNNLNNPESNLKNNQNSRNINAITESSHTKVKFGPLGLKINVDSIALDRTGSVLYFGALTGDKLNAISTSHLLYYLHKVHTSPALKSVLDVTIGRYVQEVSAEKPVTDGLTTDKSGNIYLTAVEHGTIAVALPTTTEGNVQQQTMKIMKLVQSQLLRWPDGLSFGPDGLYITNSALHLKFTNANMSQHAPFHILFIGAEDLQRTVVNKDKAMVMPAAGH